MGLFSKVLKAVEKGVEEQMVSAVSRNTGTNIRGMVREYDDEIDRLEKELKEIEQDEESIVNEYGRSEYNLLCRDIKAEIRICKQIKLDIINDVLEDDIERRREIYHNRMSEMSNKHLEKLVENTSLPPLLRKVAKEELDSRNNGYY